MNTYDEKCLNDLAGRIEGLGRVILHVVAKLEDGGVIDGQELSDGLRGSVVLAENPTALMCAAKRTLDNTANALDEARRWRAFRREVARPENLRRGPRAA